MGEPRKSREIAVRRMPAATTPEARENQLIAQAYDLVEQRIADGKASAQEVTHFLKLGSSRERLEQKRIEREIKLADAKIDNLASLARIEELYEGAMNAMRSYRGEEPVQDDFEDLGEYRD